MKKTFTYQFITSLLLLVVLSIGEVWGATASLTESEITTNITNTTCAYGTPKTYIDGDVTWTASCYTDVASRKWMQLKKDNNVYIKITVPSGNSITNVVVTLTSATNSSGGINDITKHTAYSGRVVLATTASAVSSTSTGVAYTETITSNQATLSPSGNNNELYLKTVVGSRIWGISVTYSSACANSVTISKGTGTNCTFSLSKSGAQASCDGVSTTVSITPSTGYGTPVVTQSGASKTPTISGSGNSQTVTYAANTTGTSTINVSCSALTTTVSFNQNGGEGGQTTNKTATYGQAMPTPITTPTRYGHTFGGYYDGTGGTGTQYYTETGTSARNWDKTSATATLYAKWTENALTNYRTTCCTDWSTPTVTYSSSLAINASEGVTIGSGTTHGAVTYESSDEDVLTVDVDGTIHAVGAGTAHITATWAGDATYCEKSANSNDVTVSGIQVTGTTPVNFGQVYQNAVIADKTIYVTGLGLASDITPSLPAGSPFSFSPASLAKDCSGATLTISASTATLGTYNQTLTLTSGAFSTTVTVKMEVIAKPTATFTDALHGLTEDEDGISLSSYNLTAAQGTPVVFPTLANQTKSAGTCEGEYYIFVGWTESDNNTDPEDHLVTSYTLANGDTKNYYAVWADASGSATYTKLTTNTFKTAPTKYVLGAEHEGTTYYFSYYDPTEIAYDLDWGTCSSSDAPIQFTLSGTAAELVVKDNLNNYLEAPCTTKAFYISDTETTVELKSDGTIYNNGDGCTSYRLRYNYNSGSGGLRWYTSDTGDPAYFYLVGAAGTVHYRTSCCANKVDAPVVTATTVTSTSITLTWPSDDKATGWQIEWNGAGGWVTPSGSCTHTVSGLTPNTTYTWRVRATYEDPVCGADVRSGSTTTNQVYHVTYAKGSGTGTCTAEGSTTDATGYEAGATVTLQENGFTLAGHTFAGWTEDDEDITISSNQLTMPDHDVVITASWTAKMDKYFDRMHDQTDALHGGVEETEGTNEGKYYIPKEGCNYSIPTAVDSNTGDACQTSHYKLQGWIAASHMKGYPNNMTGEIKPGEETYIFPPTGTRTATGATYYAIWAEVTE